MRRWIEENADEEVDREEWETILRDLDAARGGTEHGHREVAPLHRPMRSKLARGVIHGKTIELDEDLGLAEGQEVEVQVRVTPRSPRQPGEGFQRTEGALADDPYWDGIMEEIHWARERARRPQLEEG